MKIVQALRNSKILPESVTKAVKNKTKEQRGGFLGTLVSTLESILLGKLLSGKEIIRAGSGNKKGKWIVRAGYGKEWDYQNEPRINGVLSRNNLPEKIKNGAYVKHLDECKYTGTHWVALFCKRNEIVYFDSFGVEHVPEEI